MTHDEDSHSEETTVYNQTRSLMQDLQRLYTPENEAQSLARIRARLHSAKHDTRLSYTDTTNKGTQRIQQERILHMNTTRTQPTERKGLTHSLGMIAALIVATFVVGSLLFVMNAARQSTTSGTGAAPQQSIPNTSYGPGWKVVKTVNGTGSQTITGQNLIFHYTLGAALSCTGKGEIKVEFNGPHGKWFQEDCQKGEPGQIDFTIKIGAPYTVEKLDITTEKTNTWQLQILSCVDKNVCGKPGPVPTVSSTVEAPVPTNPAKH